MSNNTSVTKAKTLPVMVVLSLFIILVLYFLSSKERQLPIYNPADVNPKLVDVSIKHKRNGHTIADFNLINQYGEKTTQEDYSNKIYVADFFFTRCQTICPIMSTNMSDLQHAFINDDEVKFLSMSVTPVMDSVPVMKAYAEKKGAIKGKWNLTTGNKKHIYQLASKSFMAVVDEGDGGLQDFIHTEQFVLVDKKKRIRGYYDGTKKKIYNY
jgi:protein SCO1/2